MNSLPAKVLIVRLGAIGDVVNAQVVANAIKEASPATRVGWVVHELALPLVAGHPCIDVVHLWRRGSGLSGFLTLVGELRREGYGLVLDLQRIAKSGILARSAGSGRVLGFDRARSKELGWLWSTDRLAARSEGRHMLDWYLEFVEHLGLPQPRHLHRLPQDPAAVAWAEARVAAAGRAPVLVNLGASKPPNRWAPERFGELAAELLRAPGGPVWLTGGPNDRPAAERALSTAGAGVDDLVGSTSLLELAELARRSRLCVTCDTGPMHLAAAVGTPVVALFGPADPARTGPWGAGHTVVRAPGGRMDDLAVGPVLAASRARLAESR